MSEQRHYPNRVKASFADSSSAWEIIATDGVGYTSYQLLLDAGKTKYPGAPRDFPNGVPKLLAQSLATGGATAGSLFQIATNTLISPAVQDALVPANDVLVYEGDDVSSVWVKKSVTSDLVTLVGMY